MLGPDRFAAFETPNVIDPGDDAPVQPPRRGNKTTAPSPQQRQRAQQTTGESTGAPSSSRNFGRTEKIDLGDYHAVRHSSKRLLNSVDDLDLLEQQQQQQLFHGDDEDQGDAPPPSIDEARNYASALLQDANRRTAATTTGSNRRSRDGRIMLDEAPTNIPAGLMTTSYTFAMTDSSQKALVRNTVWPVATKVGACVAVLVLVVLAIARLSA